MHEGASARYRKIMDWKTVELSGYTYYSARGYRILIPLVSGEGFDFVAEKNNEYVRVNVKCAGIKTKKIPDSWSISVASGAGSKNIDEVKCDVFLVWLPAHNKFIEIGGDFFVGSKSKSKIIPKHLL